ncbi:YeiH family protein [Paraflavitalea speifideaquila]|uniref:YeiH family protein n=1 Tax=Paraflavitalea speifideaquila TaxID=3076558 RepID=UPI0028E652D7|nr:putative sulfate exporter family transporter [Paraflavitalea speifideiaquila]
MEAANKATTTAKKKIWDRTITTRELIFIAAIVLCLSPLISPPIALLMGFVIAQFIGHPWLHLNHKATHLLLQISVVGLGFGMQAGSTLKAGKEGILLATASILGTLLAGALLGRLFKTDKTSSWLIASGTAICGGSAIAAVAPVIQAREKQLSVALGTVFILNAAALFLFPAIGHALHLSEKQFGLWSAIAIHDTSSVTGAAAKYGPQALEIATTVKLARALWIVPVSLLSGFLFKGGNNRIKFPWFIGLFIAGIVFNSYVPAVAAISPYLVGGARAGLTLTLFLIGCGLRVEVLRAVGIKPLLQGIVLWVLIAAGSLWAVLHW